MRLATKGEEKKLDKRRAAFDNGFCAQKENQILAANPYKRNSEE